MNDQHHKLIEKLRTLHYKSIHDLFKSKKNENCFLSPFFLDPDGCSVPVRLPDETIHP
jgi:hypothetical protein